MKRSGVSTKGFTLVEITVIIMLMGLIGVMIAGFSVAVNKNVKQRSIVTNRIKEINSIKSAVTEWFYNYDEKGVTLSLPNSATIEANNGGEKNTISFLNSRLNWSLDGVLYSFETEQVNAISFGLNTGYDIMSCTITYDDQGVDKTQTFLLYRYLGI